MLEVFIFFSGAGMFLWLLYKVMDFDNSMF